MNFRLPFHTTAARWWVALAWHHPMQDQALLDQVPRPLQALGVSLPPPRPPGEALADEAVLGRIDALLSDVGGVTPG